MILRRIREGKQYDTEENEGGEQYDTEENKGRETI